MKNPDVKALRDEIILMISENRKKDIAINEKRAQIQDLTKQDQYMAKQNLDLARRITYYENAHSPPSQNSMPAISMLHNLLFKAIFDQDYPNLGRLCNMLETRAE